MQTCFYQVYTLCELKLTLGVYIVYTEYTSSIYSVYRLCITDGPKGLYTKCTRGLQSLAMVYTNSIQSVNSILRGYIECKQREYQGNSHCIQSEKRVFYSLYIDCIDSVYRCIQVYRSVYRCCQESTGARAARWRSSPSTGGMR